MEKFLASNEWEWRLLRTIVQGVLGVVIANLDLIMAGACSTRACAGSWWRW
jgi:hypothetical protein